MTSIVRSSKPVSPERITALARRLLDTSTLCAIATVSPRGRAHINTVYFAANPSLELVWLSDPHARHSANITKNPAVAIAVYDSHQAWGQLDRGIQLFGPARRPKGAVARQAGVIYSRRFPEYTEGAFASYCLYHFRPQWVKIFDEEALRRGVRDRPRRPRRGGGLGPDRDLPWISLTCARRTPGPEATGAVTSPGGPPAPDRA